MSECVCGESEVRVRAREERIQGEKNLQANKQAKEQLHTQNWMMMLVKRRRRRKKKNLMMLRVIVTMQFGEYVQAGLPISTQHGGGVRQWPAPHRMREANDFRQAISQHSNQSNDDPDNREGNNKILSIGRDSWNKIRREIAKSKPWDGMDHKKNACGEIDELIVPEKSRTSLNTK